jgi:hypothetical protein
LALQRDCNSLESRSGRGKVNFGWEMRKQRAQATRERSKAPSESERRPRILHSSLYLPEPVYEVLRKIAFDERLKIHDLVLEGLDAVLRRRGCPSVADLKSGTKS